jgi:hypothetical protein
MKFRTSLKIVPGKIYKVDYRNPDYIDFNGIFNVEVKRFVERSRDEVKKRYKNLYYCKLLDKEKNSLLKTASKEFAIASMYFIEEVKEKPLDTVSSP